MVAFFTPPMILPFTDFPAFLLLLLLPARIHSISSSLYIREYSQLSFSNSSSICCTLSLFPALYEPSVVISSSSDLLLSDVTLPVPISSTLPFLSLGKISIHNLHVHADTLTFPLSTFFHTTPHTTPPPSIFLLQRCNTGLPSTLLSYSLLSSPVHL